MGQKRKKEDGVEIRKERGMVDKIEEEKAEERERETEIKKIHQYKS